MIYPGMRWHLQRSLMNLDWRFWDVGLAEFSLFAAAAVDLSSPAPAAPAAPAAIVAVPSADKAFASIPFILRCVTRVCVSNLLLLLSSMVCSIPASFLWIRGWRIPYFMVYDYYLWFQQVEK